MLAAVAANRVQGRALQDAWRRAEMAKLDAQRKESAALAAEAEARGSRRRRVSVRNPFCCFFQSHETRPTAV
jgi:hypothetical protein